MVIAFPSAVVDARALARTIQKNAARATIRSVAVEHNCIIFDSSDTVKLACQLTTMLGVESVAVAKKVSSNFSDVSAAIIEVGASIIVPGDKYHVKVILQPTAKCDYVSRDIEFAVSGTLAARLASINARPARTEQDASRQVLAVIGRESAYVCIQVMSAPSGLITGSRGPVSSSIHDSLSFLSSMMAAKAGFECGSILLPYLDKGDLETSAKLVQRFATKTGRKKQTILAMPINVPAKGAVFALLKEKIISTILIRHHNNSRIVFPFSAAFHPIWFIESIFHETLSAGKMPFAPLVFLSSELVTYAQQAEIELNISALHITKGRLQSYGKTIDFEAKSAIRNTKRLELKVGPNYLHDIIDSI